MITNDLRLGNLVGVPFNPNLSLKTMISGIEIYKVIGIKPKYVDLESIEYPLSRSLAMIFHQPIPLTEEWLLKFGFEKQENNWKRICICNDWTYLYWERLAGLEVSVNKHSIMLPHINSVHQLQNLYYALTNEELTYDPN